MNKRRSRRGRTSRAASLRRVWLIVVLLALAALAAGGPRLAGSFAIAFYAANTYPNTSVSLAGLAAPTSLAASPEGNGVALSWIAGAGGEYQILSGMDTTATTGSQSCPANVAAAAPHTFSALSTLPADESPTPATPYLDAGRASGAGPVYPGDYYCYLMQNAYGYGEVVLLSTLSSGTSYSAIATSALPAPVSSGNRIAVLNGSGQSQIFVASAPASAGAGSISVNATTASSAFAAGSSSVYDLTSWPANLTTWTNPTDAASLPASGAAVEVQVGFAPDSLSLSTSGTASTTVSSGDAINVAFNQPSSVPASGAICTYGATSVSKVTLTALSSTLSGSYYGISPGMSVTDATKTADLGTGTTVIAVAAKSGTVQLTLSQPVKTSGNNQTLSFSGGTTVVVGDTVASTSGGTNDCIWGDAYDFGTLTLVSGTLAGAAENVVSFSAPASPSDSITARVGALVGGTESAASGASANWQFTAAPTLAASTSASVFACTADPNDASLCRPVAGTSF